MSGPLWLSRVLAFVMIATVLYHAARMAVSRRGRRCAEYDIDLTHLVMGVAMALMLIGALSPWSSLWWALALVVPAMWFGWWTVRALVLLGPRATSPHLQQLVVCIAMIYMLVGMSWSASTAGIGMNAMDPSVSMAGMDMAGMDMGPAGSAQPSAVALALTAATLVVVILTAARLRRSFRRRATASNALLAPVSTVGCQLAMGATMAYMLVAMV